MLGAYQAHPAFPALEGMLAWERLPASFPVFGLPRLLALYIKHVKIQLCCAGHLQPGDHTSRNQVCACLQRVTSMVLRAEC